MTLHFAAARTAALPTYLARAQMVRMATRAANDNGDGESHSDVLRATLKHFARLGLSAASDARDQARTAHFTGDRQGYLHWLAICRTLDPRMAMALACNLAKR
jgi:hypothetical protein